MRRIRLFLLIFLLLSRIGVTVAQSGGQFCVRAYEDRNGNAQFDLNEREPFITRGVNADLLNAESIVVASALMDTAPTAAQGVVCFQFLEAGQYSIVVTSADYTPTTPDTFTASISDGTLPTVVEYGAQRMAAEPVPDTSSKPDSILDQRDMLQRVVLSALGTLLVVASMIVLGVLIYLIAFHRAPAPASDYYDKPPTTGSTPAVNIIDTTDLE